MALRRFAFVPEEYYHIYNRGNSKQAIFLDQGDYERFHSLLFIANGQKSIDFRTVHKEGIFNFDRGERQVNIGAYCLMPNHFHILLTPKSEVGVLNFMKKLSTGYSMYFNKKYERTGILFEGRFKAQLVDSDEYLKYLFSYIHLNPVKLIQKDWKEKGIQDLDRVLRFLEEYRYSSFIDYEGPSFGNTPQERKEGMILDKSIFPEYFPTQENFYTEILEWITYKL